MHIQTYVDKKPSTESRKNMPANICLTFSEISRWNVVVVIWGGGTSLLFCSNVSLCRLCLSLVSFILFPGWHVFEPELCVRTHSPPCNMSHWSKQHLISRRTLHQFSPFQLPASTFLHLSSPSLPLWPPPPSVPPSLPRLGTQSNSIISYKPRRG